MIVEFREQFCLPVEDIYTYFQSPADWVRLYGFASSVKDYGDGWYAIPLQRFPFPLIARNTEQVQNERVHWVFRGFWRGRGEVRFSSTPQGTRVEGYEEISVRWLSVFSPIVERLFMRRQFERIWALGWRRLRKQANAAPPRTGN
jgi:hypothetical protein